MLVPGIAFKIVDAQRQKKERKKQRQTNPPTA